MPYLYSIWDRCSIHAHSTWSWHPWRCTPRTCWLPKGGEVLTQLKLPYYRFYYWGWCTARSGLACLATRPHAGSTSSLTAVLNSNRWTGRGPGKSHVYITASYSFLSIGLNTYWWLESPQYHNQMYMYMHSCYVKVWTFTVLYTGMTRSSSVGYWATWPTWPSQMSVSYQCGVPREPSSPPCFT